MSPANAPRRRQTTKCDGLPHQSEQYGPLNLVAHQIAMHGVQYAIDELHGLFVGIPPRQLQRFVDHHRRGRIGMRC